jgi:DNA topoisomerase-1
MSSRLTASKTLAHLPEIHLDPVESAKIAGLHYVSDDGPGIRRKKSGKGFAYYGLDGQKITDKAEIERINALAIPPAYKNVWICPDARGHIQATGLDERGRKQYRYHPKWREVRDETKFARTIEFARALPGIRARTEQDLKKPGFPREKVLATSCSIARKRPRFASATPNMRAKTELWPHDDEKRTRRGRKRPCSLHFKGKSGKWHDIDLKDRKLAAAIKK